MVATEIPVSSTNWFQSCAVALQAAAIDEIGWEDALAVVRQALDAPAAALETWDYVQHGSWGFITSGIDVAGAAHVHELFPDTNPRLEANSGICEGGVTYDYLHWDEKQLSGLDYVRAMEEHTGTRYFLGGIALKTSDYLGAVTFFREPAQGHFPEESIQRLRLLLPILKYALQTAVIVDRTKQLADLAVTNEAAVVLLNHKGRVIHANDRALQLERAGHLRGLHQAGVGFGPDRRQIGILINDAVQGRCGAARIDDGERLLDVQAVPMKPATQPLEPFHASAALILSDPQRPSPADAVALHDLFGLTPREQEIAQRLLAGQSTQSMSNQMRISPATTRVHLRSILQKTETHSQRELVALLSKYPRSL